ncbi:MAG: DEAD/DEAH box helicase family protein [Burkholderiaceae bacterium]|jgi:type III restriction enzyme|nr:DEAD/DEAH box helicase family protein [Burkholderiaceae bacterium]
MIAFTPKDYQRRLLASVAAYFDACHERQSPGRAFTAVTEALWQRAQSYRGLSGFPSDMPYFCLRVPTGGGKTWLAAKGVVLVNTRLLRVERSVILWLVPSSAIRDQTLKAMRDRSHPVHAALREAGPLEVLDLEAAKSVTRATLDTTTTLIVTTRQAFQRDEPESLKAYQSSGALMHHFDNLSETQRGQLLTDGEGADRVTPYSLANVLRLRRPFVIVDEAHNSRTELGFDMLARFAPSGVMELTATPDTEKVPSNVLHSVSAAELKLEEMIKLPIQLDTQTDWQRCLALAILRRTELQRLAEEEAREGAPYLRPIVLIQAEARRAGVETRDVERVRRELIDNQQVPAEQIVVATGETRELEELDAKYRQGIADAACPVRYVITQRALAEGWDCPSAYILVSLASLQSATAVEQLLGRVLRQPQGKHRAAAALNRSYAYVVSPSFADTAAALRDRLVEKSGFDRKEAAEFVAASDPAQARLDLEAHAGRVTVQPVTVTLTEAPDVKRLPKPLRDKLSVAVVKDEATQRVEHRVTIEQPLSEDEGRALAAAVKAPAAVDALVAAAEQSRTTAIEFFQTPAERGLRFRVPQLALRLDGELELFDDPEVLQYPWELTAFDATVTPTHIAALNAGLKTGEGGEVDVNDATGRMEARFLPALQRDLGLAYAPEHWDETRLATWLCKNLPEQKLTHSSKRVFVATWLAQLLALSGYTLARANLQKFQIRVLLEARIRELRRQAVRTAYQATLFGEGADQRVAVRDEFAFEFNPQAYAPTSDYDGRFGSFAFRRHYYGRIGDFDSKEEFECACWLDIEAQKGRIEFWVRNLVDRGGNSFFLQKADGRFFPDFICQLPARDGRPGALLAVEYKGADRWDGAKDDRDVGALWEALSGGRCRFVMVTRKEWAGIDAKL